MATLSSTPGVLICAQGGIPVRTVAITAQAVPERIWFFFVMELISSPHWRVEGKRELRSSACTALLTSPVAGDRGIGKLSQVHGVLSAECPWADDRKLFARSPIQRFWL